MEQVFFPVCLFPSCPISVSLAFLALQSRPSLLALRDQCLEPFFLPVFSFFLFVTTTSMQLLMPVCSLWTHCQPVLQSSFCFFLTRQLHFRGLPLGKGVGHALVSSCLYPLVTPGVVARNTSSCTLRRHSAYSNAIGAMLVKTFSHGHTDSGWLGAIHALKKKIPPGLASVSFALC